MDTGAWVALSDAGDQYHERAKRIQERLRREGRILVTTDLVVSEAYAFIRSRAGGPAALKFVAATRSSPTTRRIHVTDEWQLAAEELLARYADQSFTYVDATSFVAMRRLRIREAFAFDNDFVVAGFELFGEVA